MSFDCRLADRRLAVDWAAPFVPTASFRSGFPEESEFLTSRKFHLRQASQIQPVGLANGVHPIFPSKCEETLKIEKHSSHGKAMIRLIGRFQSEHVDELKKQIRSNGTHLALDLLEVTLVDVGVVQFLALCEADGVELLHCPPYIREWIRRERQG
jgi:hypothetical protein